MGLMCMDRTEINYIHIAYFIAYGIAGFIWFPIPDRWGCKKTMLTFGSVNILSQFVLLLVPDYTVRLVFMGVMGATQLKNSTSYAWLFGLLRSKDISMCCAFLNGWDQSSVM